MRNKYSSHVNNKTLPCAIIIIFAIAILAVGAYTDSTGNFQALTSAAEVAPERQGESNVRTLTAEYTKEAQLFTILTAQGTYSDNYVYNDEPGEPESSAEQDPGKNQKTDSTEEETFTKHSETAQIIEQNDKASGTVHVLEGSTIKIGQQSANGTTTVDQDPDEDQKPDSIEEEADTKHSEIAQTIEQNEKASGTVDVLEGSTIKIGQQPANGTTTVDQNGNWEYTPEPGFSGKDQFTMIVEHDDGSEEVITVTVTVDETEIKDDDEKDDPEEETLPISGGVVLASLVALWLFMAASLSLRVGIISKKQ